MQPTVLLIDDDQDTLTMLVKTLHGHLPGLLLETATNARDALQIIAQTPCDLIISDIIMPGMDGMEFLHEVRHGAPETLVVLITGGPLTPKAEALADGAHAVIRKPFEVPSFIALVGGCPLSKKRSSSGESVQIMSGQSSNVALRTWSAQRPDAAVSSFLIQAALFATISS